MSSSNYTINIIDLSEDSSDDDVMEVSRSDPAAEDMMARGDTLFEPSQREHVQYSYRNMRPRRPQQKTCDLSNLEIELLLHQEDEMAKRNALDAAKQAPDVTNACPVCLSRTASHIWQPCGHYAACNSCASMVATSSDSCPVCRTPPLPADVATLLPLLEGKLQKVHRG